MTPNFFDDESPYLTHPLLTEPRTTAEVDHIEKRLGLTPGARLLDIGCGCGRHSIELAARGYEVVGVDPSITMITAARNRATANEVDVEFVLGDISAVPTGSPFDGAVCLFTTLGQIGPEGDNADLISRAATLLTGGSRLAVEIPQRDAAQRSLEPTTEITGQGVRTVITREYAKSESVATERFTVTRKSETRIFLLKYRLFSADELEAQLRYAGFVDIEFSAGYEPAPLTPDSLVMLASARVP